MRVLFQLSMALMAVTCAAQTNISTLHLASGVSQLFVDDALIASQSGLKRTLRQPKKDNGGNIPILALDTEYPEVGATLEANGTIVYDSRLKKYVMFALAY